MLCALAAEQDIILMDEPFGALDPMRYITRFSKGITTKIRKNIYFVTHDMDEAIKLADKICIMSKEKSFNTIHLTIFYDILQMTLLEILLGKIA